MEILTFQKRHPIKRGADLRAVHVVPDLKKEKGQSGCTVLGDIWTNSHQLR